MNNDFLSRRGKRKNTHHNQTNPANWERPAHFRTPEEIAASEEPDSAPQPMARSNTTKKSFKERLQNLSKKQRILIAAVAFVVVALIAFAVCYLLLRDSPKPVKKAEVKKPVVQAPAPIPILSTLTGLPIADASINNRPVTAIMIENSTDARPQSALNQAGVVFEAIAEGGITRFLTLWQDTAPEYIGPVRSVRPYYLQWLQGFDAAVAHVGGSADALKLIKDWGVKDLDQFHNTAPYWRVNTRFAPHNMYTSLPKLMDLEAKKGFGKANYTGFARKPKETPSPTVTARTIDFNISGALYNSHYDYDATTNSYLRSEGGKPHIDASTNQQINPKVVIGLVMPQGHNGIYTTYNTLGSGTAYVFQDGTVTQGTWAKTSNSSQFVFKDSNGAELKLNPGRTWLSVVGSTDRVSYKP